jgi:hypothetical protein
MEKAIEEQMRDAVEAAESPITIDKDESKTASGLGAHSMEAGKVLSAGQVYIYDTKTGDQSICNRNNLPHNLKKKRPDGSLVFTTVKPNFEPAKGTHLCMLHRDYPERKFYDTLGFAVCPKSNLTSAYQVRRHMEKRHKSEWGTIKEELANKERAEARAEKEKDRELQRAILKQASAKEPKGKK